MLDYASRLLWPAGRIGVADGEERGLGVRRLRRLPRLTLNGLLVSSSTRGKDSANGFQKNPYVANQAPVLDVRQIQPNRIFPRECRTSANLPRTGNTRLG